MRSQWQGEHLERHKPLSKAEVRRLLRDVNRSMVAYRRNLGIYGRFFETWGEEPLEGFRYHQPYSAYKPPIAKSDEPEEPEPAEGPLDPEEIKASILFGTSAAEDDLGGESPLPDWEWEDA